MRYITIPETIHLKNIKGKKYDEPLPFVEWIVTAILNMPYWSKGDEKLLASADIEERLEDSAPGDVIQMAEDEWEHLGLALKEASFIPHEGRQIKTYIRSIKNAPNRRPKPESVPDEEVSNEKDGDEDAA